MESGWDFAWNLAGNWLHGKLAEILARNWLHGENWQDLAGILPGIWLEEVPAAPPGSPWDGGWAAGSWLAERLWLETGCTGKLAEILARNWLHGENWQDLAEILAEKWLPGGKLAGNWLAGGNSDFPRKSEFRPKPPRTTNFHLKDPGIDQLESLTLVTMVIVSCKFDIVHAFQILVSKSHFGHF